MLLLPWRARHAAIPRLWCSVHRTPPWTTSATSHHQHQCLSTDTLPSKQQLLTQLQNLEPNPANADTAQHLLHQLAPFVPSMHPTELIDTLCVAGRHAAISHSFAAPSAFTTNAVTVLVQQPTSALDPPSVDQFINALSRLNLLQTPPCTALAADILVSNAASISAHAFEQAVSTLSKTGTIAQWGPCTQDALQRVQGALANPLVDAAQASQLVWYEGCGRVVCGGIVTIVATPA